MPWTPSPPDFSADTGWPPISLPCASLTHFSRFFNFTDSFPASQASPGPFSQLNLYILDSPNVIIQYSHLGSTAWRWRRLHKRVPVAHTSCVPRIHAYAYPHTHHTWTFAPFVRLLHATKKSQTQHALNKNRVTSQIWFSFSTVGKRRVGAMLQNESDSEIEQYAHPSPCIRKTSHTWLILYLPLASIHHSILSVSQSCLCLFTDTSLFQSRRTLFHIK